MEVTMVSFSARAAASLDAKTAFAAAFLKMSALACAIVTLLLAALVLGWQAGAWFLTGQRSPFPISRALALAGFDELSETDPVVGIQGFFDWVVNLPASGFLLAVAAILIGFSIFAASVEGQFNTTKGQPKA